MEHKTRTQRFDGETVIDVTYCGLECVRPNGGADLRGPGEGPFDEVCPACGEAQAKDNEP